jgi:hypothetical protein
VLLLHRVTLPSLILHIGFQILRAQAPAETVNLGPCASTRQASPQADPQSPVKTRASHRQPTPAISTLTCNSIRWVIICCDFQRASAPTARGCLKNGRFPSQIFNTFSLFFFFFLPAFMAALFYTRAFAGHLFDTYPSCFARYNRDDFVNFFPQSVVFDMIRKFHLNQTLPLY